MEGMEVGTELAAIVQTLTALSRLMREAVNQSDYRRGRVIQHRIQAELMHLCRESEVWATCSVGWALALDSAEAIERDALSG